jgi:hypothetical protein
VGSGSSRPRDAAAEGPWGLFISRSWIATSIRNLAGVGLGLGVGLGAVAMFFPSGNYRLVALRR